MSRIDAGVRAAGTVVRGSGRCGAQDDRAAASAGNRLERVRPTTAFAPILLGLAGLLDSGVALAADGAIGHSAVGPFSAGHIFTFLFLMLGPFKIVGPFVLHTRGTDAASTHRIALWATLFASLAIAFAAVLGERIVAKYGIPVPVLALAAGVILFVVALRHILEQFDSPGPGDDAPSTQAPVQAMKLALSPLAFPTIVTPYGIAAVVVFMALSADLQGRLTIGAIVLGIMLSNLLVMLVAKRMPPILGLVLPIVGAVLGVVQVALGLQIINNSLRALLAA
jgi:multiple antibiotic resistance protein